MENKIQLKDSVISYKKRAWYAFVGGIARAGVYFFS